MMWEGRVNNLKKLDRTTSLSVFVPVVDAAVHNIFATLGNKILIYILAEIIFFKMKTIGRTSSQTCFRTTIATTMRT